MVRSIVERRGFNEERGALGNVYGMDLLVVQGTHSQPTQTKKAAKGDVRNQIIVNNAENLILKCLVGRLITRMVALILSHRYIASHQHHSSAIASMHAWNRKETSVLFTVWRTVHGGDPELNQVDDDPFVKRRQTQSQAFPLYLIITL